MVGTGQMAEFGCRSGLRLEGGIITPGAGREESASLHNGDSKSAQAEVSHDGPTISSVGCPAKCRLQ